MRERATKPFRAVVTALSEPAYVGDNRCWPCTVLNLVVLGIGVIAVAWSSLGVAIALAVFGVIAIVLRGYLVPYTPQFAPRLVAALPGPSVKGPNGRSETGAIADGDVDGEQVLETLLDRGIVGGSSELTLNEGIRDRWWDSIEELRDDDLTSAIETTIPGVTAERYTWQGDDWFSLESTTGTDTSESLSRPVTLADVAAVRVLTNDGVSETVAVYATRPLRQFLTTCPECDGALSVQHDSCCGGFGPDGPDQILACDECRASIFAFDD